jgi:hypothetical protein
LMSRKAVKPCNGYLVWVVFPYTPSNSKKNKVV